MTRTRGPDAAASVARAAEVMVAALEGAVQERFKKHLCQYAATGGPPGSPKVGAGPGAPLGQVDVREGCHERAPGGPPVGAGQGARLKHLDVQAGCKEQAPRGPPFGAGPGARLGQQDLQEGCQKLGPQSPPMGAGH